MVHNWSIKGCHRCCLVCGKVHIKDPLLHIWKSSLCGKSGLPLNKYVTVTICLMSNRRWYGNQCTLEALLNKTSSLKSVEGATAPYLWREHQMLRSCLDPFPNPLRSVSLATPVNQNIADFYDAHPLSLWVLFHRPSRYNAGLSCGRSGFRFPVKSNQWFIKLMLAII